MEQRSRVGATPGVELDAGAEIEVAKLDRGEAVAVHAQDVLRLKVPVCDPLGVEELKSRRNITNNVNSLLFCEVFSETFDNISLCI